MRRSDLEHIIRAASTIADDDEIIIDDELRRLITQLIAVDFVEAVG